MNYQKRRFYQEEMFWHIILFVWALFFVGYHTYMAFTIKSDWLVAFNVVALVLQSYFCAYAAVRIYKVITDK